MHVNYGDQLILYDAVGTNYKPYFGNYYYNYHYCIFVYFYKIFLS